MQCRRDCVDRDLGRFGTGVTGFGIPQPGRWQRPDRRPSESRQIGTHQDNHRRFQGRDAWRHRIRNPARGYLTLLQSGRESARNFAAAVLWIRPRMAGQLVCVAVCLQFGRHRPVAPARRMQAWPSCFFNGPLIRCSNGPQMRTAGSAVPSTWLAFGGGSGLDTAQWKDGP